MNHCGVVLGTLPPKVCISAPIARELVAIPIIPHGRSFLGAFSRKTILIWMGSEIVLRKQSAGRGEGMKKFLLLSMMAFPYFDTLAYGADYSGCSNISTIAGKLTVVPADWPGNDVLLNGVPFDHGSFLDGACDKHTLKNGLVDRMLTYVYIHGGFSPPPSTVFYDFRVNPPDVTLIGDGNVFPPDEIKWTEDKVFLKLKGKWYRYDDDENKLIRIKKKPK